MNPIEPVVVAEIVEAYVDDERHNARKFENRTPLDNSGVWTLHQMAAEVYALGFDAGVRTEVTRERGNRQRKAEDIGDAFKAGEVAS